MGKRRSGRIQRDHHVNQGRANRTVQLPSFAAAAAAAMTHLEAAVAPGRGADLVLLNGHRLDFGATCQQQQNSSAVRSRLMVTRGFQLPLHSSPVPPGTSSLLSSLNTSGQRSLMLYRCCSNDIPTQQHPPPNPPPSRRGQEYSDSS